MDTAHIIMAAAAALTGTATAITARTHGHQRLVITIACAALVIGHLVCLLEGAPTWYSTTLTIITIAAPIWALTATVIRHITGNRSHTTGTISRPHTQTLYPRHTGIVEAEIVDDGLATVHSIIRDTPTQSIDRQHLLDAGPVNAALTTGNTYVAADITTYTSRRRTTNQRTRPLRPASPHRENRARQIRAAYAQEGFTRSTHDYRA
ncbi:Uncharacterised protein [Dermatophilus congolensis]|uniref:Uncharacterized protein n=1 Tax=Dermatophilus congolensis TaxID=1863 RepID=A0A239V5T9_9MICO|nr:hypothetical protein [Dermatophilus congolensis]SNV17611.1 Uncharacterised protein [Dermatophilus congolensis]